MNNHKKPVSRPPRRQPGDLQTLPPYPLMFTWPMNAYERIKIMSGEPHVPVETNSKHYMYTSQIRQCQAGNKVHPDFMDLRGGPANLRNVTYYNPHLSSIGNKPQQKSFFEMCDYIVKVKRSKTIDDEWMKKFGKKLFYKVEDKISLPGNKLQVSFERLTSVSCNPILQPSRAEKNNSKASTDYFIELRRDDGINEKWLEVYGRKYFYIDDANKLKLHNNKL